MRAMCSWSGGKDCCLAYYKAISEGIEICHLLNFVTEDAEHSVSHGLDSELMALQAEAMGVHLIQKRVRWGDYEQAMKQVIEGLKPEGITAEVFGDIHLQEHRDWLDRVCTELGITPVFPLWQQDTRQLIEDFIVAGFEAIVVSVRNDVMGWEWLGRKVDRDFVRALQRHDGEVPVDFCGEKGEFHTVVLDGPVFEKRLVIEMGDVVEENGHFLLRIPRYRIEGK